MFFLIPAILETNDMKICLSFLSLYSVNSLDSQFTKISSHASYSLKPNTGLIIVSKSFSLFHFKNFEARAQTLLHIRLRQILLLIWYFIFQLISYGFLLVDGGLVK